MPYLPLSFPPGIVRPGTPYDAKGRWYDCNLVRWHEGTLGPVGGFALLSGGGSVAVGGAPRGILGWRRNAGVAFVGLGTPTKLKVYSAGTLSDITPSSGFTTGSTDASGSFYSRTEATTWQLDAYGEDLVAVSTADGKINYWDSSVGVGTPAAALTNAPTSCKGVVVTPEGFIVALGASGDGRLVKWCDQDDITNWTAGVNNQAGDVNIRTNGLIQSGAKTKSDTLIWTDVDLWSMRYIGGTLVYGFVRVGSQCGAISRLAMGMVGETAYWMGRRGFYVYDGAVRPIPCEVGDYVFNRLTQAQVSKVCCVVNSDFNEVTWYYPSTAGTENDSGVTYNYAQGWWSLSTIARSSGIDRGFLEYPIVASPGGAIFEHEKGTQHQDEAGSVAYIPYIESGPLEIGEGDRVMHITGYIPDEETLGEVQTRLYTRLHPTASETTSGPYTNTNPTSIRLTARQVRIRHTQVTGGFRIGTPRLEVIVGGKR